MLEFCVEQQQAVNAIEINDIILVDQGKGGIDGSNATVSIYQNGKRLGGIELIESNGAYSTARQNGDFGKTLDCVPPIILTALEAALIDDGTIYGDSTKKFFDASERNQR